MTGAVIDDAALAERCRGGDDAAWAELVDRYSRYVYAIAARGYDLRDDDAEDVFQDVFARAYSNLDKLRDPGALRPWLGQLTRRLCVDHIRANREEPTGEQDEEATLGTLAHLDTALSVRDALKELPEHCREILDRFFARDESYRMIGEALDIPPGTIASRIARCLGKLKTSLEMTT